MAKFTTQLVAEAAGYLEHIFMYDGKESRLVAVIYNLFDNQEQYSYSHCWAPSKFPHPKRYNTVADAKHDLFLEVEWHLKLPIEQPRITTLVDRNLLHEAVNQLV